MMFMCEVIRVYHWVVVYHWPVDDCISILSILFRVKYIYILINYYIILTTCH